MWAGGVLTSMHAVVTLQMYHATSLRTALTFRPTVISAVHSAPHCLQTPQDATSNVLWWVGVVCDPAASTPGPTELARRPPEDWWPRDRNARVPWSLLEAALREAVLSGGDQQRYLEQYYTQGLHKWHLLPGGQLQWGGRCPNSTRTA